MSVVDIRRVVGEAPAAPLLTLAGLTLVSTLDGAALGVVLPEIRREFDVSLASVGAISAAVAPFAVLAQLPLAHRADRRPRVGLAAAGPWAWVAFAVLTGLAPVLAVLLIARIGSAVTKSVNVTHASLLADYYEPSVRGGAFYVYDLGNVIGLSLAPLVAGVLADAVGWRVPFVLLAVPMVLMALAVRRLPEPERGAHERHLEGGGPELDDIQDTPPTFTETFRVLYSLRTVRWFYAAIVFVGAGALGVGAFASFLYDEVFGAGATARGVIEALLAPAALPGLLLGGRLVQERLESDPRAALRVIAAAAAVAGAGILVMATAPTLPLAVAGSLLAAAAAAAVFPGVSAVAAQVVPARMRTLGFATGSVWALLGVLAYPLIGTVADRHGMRVGVALFVPLALAAAACLLVAGNSVAADIARVRSATVARAQARRRRLIGDPHVLMVHDLHVKIDGHEILAGIDLEVADGEVVAVLGTNGAGKSTLLRTISGLISPTGGSIVFDGFETAGADPTALAGMGLVHAPSSGAVFPSLTVREHLDLASWSWTRHGMVAGGTRAIDVFPALAERLDTRASELSGGERQMVNLAQAVLARPRLLLVDELSLGLSPALADSMLDAVRRMNDAGTTVVLVEQSPETALRVASRVVYLDKGQVTFAGSARSFRRRVDLRAPTYLKAPTSEDRGAVPHADDSGALLACRGVEKRFDGIVALQGVDLEVAAGEIVGIVGPNGSGKTTLLDVVSGFETADAGRVLLQGQDVSGLTASERSHRGVGRSFQDGRLWPALTVEESLALGLERNGDVGGESDARLRAAARTFAERYRLGDLLHAPTSELSTGQRRIVELAAVFAGAPSLLLLDEPTAGIARAEIDGLISLILDLRDRSGCGIALVEHELDFARAVCDRVVVLVAGRTIASGATRTVLSDPEVVAAHSTRPRRRDQPR
jgi:branched-chain amino acid transport system ATP-binding protein